MEEEARHKVSRDMARRTEHLLHKTIPVVNLEEARGNRDFTIGPAIEVCFAREARHSRTRFALSPLETITAVLPGADNFFTNGLHVRDNTAAPLRHSFPKQL